MRFSSRTKIYEGKKKTKKSLFLLLFRDIDAIYRTIILTSDDYVTRIFGYRSYPTQNRTDSDGK